MAVSRSPRLPIRFATTTRLGGRVHPPPHNRVEGSKRDVRAGADRGPLILDGREDPAAVVERQAPVKGIGGGHAADGRPGSGKRGSTENVGLPVASVCALSTVNVSEM